MRTLFVGDVHGCRRELSALLERVRFEPAHDTLVLVGDLVAKGPDPAGVIDLARDLGALAVRGNHDEHCLRWYRASKSSDPLPDLKPTHRAVVDALDEAQWQYLAGLPLTLLREEVAVWEGAAHSAVRVVHAGLDPAVSLADQDPANLMNMRSIRRDGSISKRIEATPWGARWSGPELAIYGHDAMRGLQKHPHAIGLDTGCCYGGKLTGALLEDGHLALVDVPAERVWSPPGGNA